MSRRLAGMNSSRNEDVVISFTSSPVAVYFLVCCSVAVTFFDTIVLLLFICFTNVVDVSTVDDPNMFVTEPRMKPHDKPDKNIQNDPTPPRDDFRIRMLQWTQDAQSKAREVRIDSSAVKGMKFTQSYEGE